MDIGGARYLEENLGLEALSALTPAGRARLTKKMTYYQMLAERTILKKFLEEELSTVREIRKFREKIFEQEKKNFPSLKKEDFSFEVAEIYYKTYKYAYDWILDYMSESDFHKMKLKAQSAMWSEEKWRNEIVEIISHSPDVMEQNYISILYRVFVQGGEL